MPKSEFPEPLSGKQFKGVLTKPIDRVDENLVLLTIGSLAFTKDWPRHRADGMQLAREIETEQVDQRILALREHYFPEWPKVDSIEQTSFVELKLIIDALGKDFLRGFQDVNRVRGSGRPPASRDPSMIKFVNDWLREVVRLRAAGKIASPFNNSQCIRAATEDRKSPFYKESRGGLRVKLKRFLDSTKKPSKSVYRSRLMDFVQARLSGKS